MSLVSTSSTISSQKTLYEKKSKIKNGSNIKNISHDTKPQPIFPKIDTSNKKTINHDVVKRWGKAERRLTLVSFPKILNERKKKDKLEEEKEINKERKIKFLKSLGSIKKLDVSLEDPDIYFNTFLPLYFGSSGPPEILNTNQLPSDDIRIDSKNYITTFKQFYNNFKEVERERKKYYDNYNVNVIRKRQFIDLQKKIEKNEGVLKEFLDIGNNLQEEEIINNFNQMTDQFATLTFKLCHLISIKESKNLKNLTKDNNGTVARCTNDLEKEVDCQLSGIEYQIKEIDNDITIILKLLKE